MQTALRTAGIRIEEGYILLEPLAEVEVWGIPGGRLEPGESAEAGCLRELENVPSGQRHELCRGLHAEQNAIIQSALHGVSIKGSTLYCTNHPCIICSKMIINAGIIKVVYKDGYQDPMAEEILKEAGVESVKA